MQRTPSPLLTVGHGTADRPRLTALLHGADVARVVDVRSAPGSRRNPDVGRQRLEQWLVEEGVDYRWDRRLGGFRKVRPDSPDIFWRNDSFRGYAGHTREPEFLAAMDELLADAGIIRTTVLCSEAVWWRCHRRLIADYAVLARRVPVRHLMHDGTLRPHIPTEGARLSPDGLLFYDKPQGTE